MESKTPICDRWEYDTNQGGLVVPLNVAKELETELAEARAEIERLENEVFKWQNMLHGSFVESGQSVIAISEKNKLIEQMREALELALTEARSTHCENTIKAALEAAERGE